MSGAMYKNSQSGYCCPKCGSCYDYEEESDRKEMKKKAAPVEKCDYEERCISPKKCMLSPETARMMRAAVDDELSAVAEYATLARKLHCNPTLQAWVTNIAGDEYGHARAFSMTLAAAGCLEHEHKEKCCHDEWED